MNCPNCSRGHLVLMRKYPLYECNACAYTCTLMGDEVAVSDFVRYVQAAKTMPLLRSFTEEDTLILPVVPCDTETANAAPYPDDETILAGVTMTPHDFHATVIRLMDGGFTHSEALQLIATRAEYAAGIRKR